MFIHVTAGDKLLKVEEAGAETESTENQLDLNETAANNDPPQDECRNRRTEDLLHGMEDRREMEGQEEVLEWSLLLHQQREGLTEEEGDVEETPLVAPWQPILEPELRERKQ
ncbi:hypothetical protein SRHO_G00064380 [Serrasalmus rhombeus]